MLINRASAAFRILHAIIFRAAFILLVSQTCAGCAKTPTLHHGNEASLKKIQKKSPIRVHTKDGHLYVLDQWWVSDSHVAGKGQYYSVLRDSGSKGDFKIPFSDVAVIETREVEFMKDGYSGTIIGIMSALTIATLVGTVSCIANPKACWGSCPTFYVQDQKDWKLQAEGFSTSVARSLEAGDLDALPAARPNNGFVTIQMRNEALETHVLRSLKLVSVEVPANTSVWQTHDNNFIALSSMSAPSECSGEGTACLQLLKKSDGKEYALSPDPSDLAVRKDIVLSFPPPGKKEAAVAITARNSLLSTFVFYHTLALFGTKAVEFIAALEKKDPEALAALWVFNKILGGIDVSVRQDDSSPWKHEGTFPFTGPIAYSHKAVPVTIEDPGLPFQVRLSFAVSHWKIDSVAAGVMEGSNLPSEEIVPASAEKNGKKEAEVLDSVLNEDKLLVTLPGDCVEFNFPVKTCQKKSHAYFLKSRGYYYEWIREAWLKEEDIEAAKKIVSNPREALRTLAPLYYELEPGMEEIFKQSKINIKSQ